MKTCMFLCSHVYNLHENTKHASISPFTCTCVVYIVATSHYIIMVKGLLGGSNLLSLLVRLLQTNTKSHMTIMVTRALHWLTWVGRHAVAPVSSAVSFPLPPLSSALERQQANTVTTTTLHHYYVILTQLYPQRVAFVVGIDKPLVDKQLSVGAGAVENPEFTPRLGELRGIALARACFKIEVGSHEAVGVVAHVPEWDQSQRRLLHFPERNLVLP